MRCSSLVIVRLLATSNLLKRIRKEKYEETSNYSSEEEASGWPV